MEQPKITPAISQDAEFKKRRNQKNWIVLGLITASIILIWAITIIKIQNGMELAHPIGVPVQAAPQNANDINQGGKNAQ